jgi:glucose-1-phosphate thymidylyltransferase
MGALSPDQEVDGEVIGLIPAGGLGTRIAPLPCSKELYPIGFRSGSNRRDLRPKVVSHYLLEKMRLAGITKAYIVLRKGKWDIPAYFGNGSIAGMNLAYVIAGSPLGPPYTLDQAYPFVQRKLVAFGFPDIIFKAKDAYRKLIMRQSATGADAVLGLFPARNPREVDMVNIDDEGEIRSISIKPRKTRLQYTWIFAVWTPTFSHFMHLYLRSGKLERIQQRLELCVGEVFQAAIDNELHFEGVLFDDHNWIDIGRPDDLVKAVRSLK